MPLRMGQTVFLDYLQRTHDLPLSIPIFREHRLWPYISPNNKNVKSSVTNLGSLFPANGRTTCCGQPVSPCSSVWVLPSRPPPPSSAGPILLALLGSVVPTLLNSSWTRPKPTSPRTRSPPSLELPLPQSLSTVRHIPSFSFRYSDANAGSCYRARHLQDQ